MPSSSLVLSPSPSSSVSPSRFRFLCSFFAFFASFFTRFFSFFACFASFFASFSGSVPGRGRPSAAALARESPIPFVPSAPVS